MNTYAGQENDCFIVLPKTLILQSIQEEEFLWRGSWITYNHGNYPGTTVENAVNCKVCAVASIFKRAVLPSTQLTDVVRLCGWATDRCIQSDAIEEQLVTRAKEASKEYGEDNPWVYILSTYFEMISQKKEDVLSFVDKHFPTVLYLIMRKSVAEIVDPNILKTATHYREFERAP